MSVNIYVYTVASVTETLRYLLLVATVNVVAMFRRDRMVHINYISPCVAPPSPHHNRFTAGFPGPSG